MDNTTFDRIVRLTAAGSSRRSFLRMALGPIATAAIAAPLIGFGSADARKKRRKHHGNTTHGNQGICLADGALCGEFAEDRDASCCTSKTGRICARALNASNSDTTCCGGAGAVCGGDNEDLDDVKPYCCQGFVCSTDGLGTGQRGTCVRQQDEKW